MSTVKQSANFIVESICPPEMHNVLWMDVAIPGNPILKVWQKGKWIPTFTDQSKAVNLMAHSIYDMVEENLKINDVYVLMGKPTDTASESTLFGKIAGISSSIDFGPVEEAIEQIDNKIGRSTDDETYSTLFGKITNVYESIDESRNILLNRFDDLDDIIGSPVPGQARTLFEAIASQEGGDPLLRQFFDITEATEFVPATSQEIIDELENIWDIVNQ